MASAKSRSELRRQKILQNSELRMQKLMGIYSKDTPDKESPLTVKSAEESPKPEITELGTTEPEIQKTKIERENNAEYHQNHFNRKETEPVINDLNEQSSDLVEHPIDNQTTDSNSANIEKLRTLLFVMMAAVVRCFLSTGYGVLYFKSIVLPFTLIQVAYISYIYLHDMVETPDGSGDMLTCALMLAGVKQDIIKTYTKVSHIVNSIGTDFAVYLFTFILFHGLFLLFT